MSHLLDKFSGNNGGGSISAANSKNEIVDENGTVYEVVTPGHVLYCDDSMQSSSFLRGGWILSRGGRMLSELEFDDKFEEDVRFDGL